MTRAPMAWRYFPGSRHFLMAFLLHVVQRGANGIRGNLSISGGKPGITFNLRDFLASMIGTEVMSRRCKDASVRAGIRAWARTP